jgi:RNA polymerase-binding transcription factor DksA
MDQTTLHELQNKLMEEQMLLEAELASVGTPLAGRAHDWVPSVGTIATDTSELEDRAAEISEFEDRNAIEEPLEKRYHEILAALEAMQSHDYGTCSVCGKEIEFARLLANPAAKTCKTHLNT